MMFKIYHTSIILVFIFVFTSCTQGQNNDSVLNSTYVLKDVTPTEKFQLVQKNLISNDLKEVSGLVCGRNNPSLIYMIEDKGGKNEVYVFSKNGEYKTKFIISGIANIDWEDIAIGVGPEKGKQYIYIADIGDNDGTRDHVRIIRFEEPKILDIKQVAHVITSSEIIKFKYPGGAKDAETLLLDPFTKQLLIVSKREETAVIYEVNNNHEHDKMKEAKIIGYLPFKKIVGGDISSDGKHMVLKNKKNVYYWKTDEKSVINTFIQSTPKTISNYIIEPQGESIGFDSNNTYFYTITETKKIPNATPILYQYGN